METLAPRMFARWCQENFLAHMMKHFAIDLLAEYGLDEFHDTEKVVNPEWRELEKRRNSVANKLRYRRAKFTELSMNPIEKNEAKKYEKWLNDKSELHEEIRFWEKELNDLKRRKKQAPKHVEWSELSNEHKFKRLVTSRKRLTDAVKMIAYRAETAMANIITGPTVTLSDARTMLRNLYSNEADVIPDWKTNSLRVRVHGASTSAENRVIHNLLEELNQAEVEYPGTTLRMRYESRVPHPPEKRNGVNSTSHG